MTGPIYTPLVESLPSTVPFVGPETQERERGREFTARIGANESVFGPSPKAIEAMTRAAAEIWKYGDPENHDLRHALAAHHGVKPENITVGEGIDGMFGYLNRMLVEPGVTVATSLGAYPTFNFHVAGYGGRLVTAPYVDDREDPESLIALAKAEGARLIYFANPDNPMGGFWEAAAMKRMIESVPDGALLCLDEAYIDFAPEGAALEIDPDDTRVIRFRTFSKAHGMAGARVAYAIAAAPLVTAFDKVRNHFGVNRVAQAGALAALADREWLAEVKRRVAEARARISKIAEANGLTTLPSATNFVAIDCGGDGAFAKAVLDGLIARDIFVRMPFVAPQNRCIRVSAGRPADLDAFEAALPGALADARAG
ncbi:pyridoxal phosphate-dependent aminotransferase [Pikeienuella piscinae]|uniref:histidinol-phosphate transaminase n=1 Tax=Pikeienuella piscinae TaxID=2748098 RepID=A0A7M3T5M5_9RHOB|nr:pyridoxal phosphate-dependent aminotransferase [Pikeienuella piscinae]QIE57306.1 pyridoxal phosphate-dependent aminotransferase [Pikeienuella piscinae]